MENLPFVLWMLFWPVVVTVKETGKSYLHAKQKRLYGGNYKVLKGWRVYLVLSIYAFNYVVVGYLLYHPVK